MKYFIRNSTLFLRGDFTAASTGIRGGVGRVFTIFNHTVPDTFDHAEPQKYLDLLVAGHGFGPEYFGMLTAVEMDALCVLQYDFITVFVTAGVRNPNPDGPGTINIIVHSREGLSPGALLEAIITATEAKAHALVSRGHSFTGTSTDAVVVAYEGEAEVHTYAGTLTEAGSRIYEAVRFGVTESLKRHEGEVSAKGSAFFIYSRFGGHRWVEWTPENCPYYPCHFEGQRCDFCYCPFYPCLDEELGSWVESSSGGSIWSCQKCELVHIPDVADYLKKYPEASLQELKRVREKK